MMDELELLKKDWQKQDATLPKFTKQDIYPMILKKSSSLVKWIFVISIIEFALWILLSFGLKIDEPHYTEIENSLSSFDTIVTAIHFIALIVFMVWFYVNYRKIQSTDSAKVLMENILKTRKTVKFYIYFNLAFLVLGSIIAFTTLQKTNPELFAGADTMVQTATFVGFIIVTLLILFIFYRLIYGILLKRLKANYKQLKKLEI